MSYDGITMAAVCHEAQKYLVGARVEKIVQPKSLEIIIHMRTRERTFHLLCSADSQLPRVHFTEQKPENPATAPAFCMLLRKHLNGARFLSVEQNGLERVLSFHFRSYDDFGQETKKTLICEVMGKHSNLILTMPREDGPYILGSIKTVTEEMSRHRAVYPGEPYILPPAQDKLGLFTLTEEALAQKLVELASLPSQRILVSAVLGLGPETASEITYRASGGDQAHPLEMVRSLTVELRKLARDISDGHYQPCRAHLPGEKPVISPILLTSVPPAYLTGYSSVNECLDSYFSELLLRRREAELRQQLSQAVKNVLSRTKKKQQLQEKELMEMEGADRYRIWGEMLTANIHLLRPGIKEASVPNYYVEDQAAITIPLNPALPPQENAQRYFKKYRKLKDGAKILAGRHRETIDELNYLESLLNATEHADLEALLEIREEMELAGVIRARKEKKKPTDTASSPLHFVSADGIDIFVGKNNRQNDRLTLRDAAPNDTWLHTKDIPGAHVIVKSATPPDTTLLEAARLAARYSKASGSANVPVDYTLARHVRKPKGAKPGMVIYDHHHTVYVTP